MKSLALLAECSPEVGSGHVVETLHLSRAMGRLSWRAYLTRETPKALARRFGPRAERIADLSPKTLERLAGRLQRAGTAAAVINGLTVAGGQVRALKKHGLKVAVLTASGKRPTGCDAWFDLDIGRGGNGGARNMVLAPDFARLAGQPRRHRGAIRELLILLGGTDSSGSTARLVRLLAGRLPGVRKHVVAGPNFARPQELTRALKKAGAASFILHRDPPNLPALMRRCDAAFTLGSDTSLELACVGTPTILLHEAPHEKTQALYLARKGCGLYAGASAAVTGAKALGLLRRLDDPALRGRCARAGQRLVDGKGAERIARALKGLLA